MIDSTITNCAFIGNSAEIFGGVFYVVDNSTINGSITSCEFENNTSINGGVFYLQSEFDETNFIPNTGC